MNLKQIVRDNKFLRRAATKILRAVRKYPVFWNIDVLEKYAHQTDAITFVQIGSNNGINGDPLYKYIISKKWKGILVEPVHYLFNELVKNYQPYAENLIFENSAVSDKNGKLKFYRLKKSDNPDLPDWYEQLGSFRKDVVLKHRNAIPGFDDLLLEDEVNALTFQALLDKHDFSKVKVVHIDTEGYDFEVLKLIPFGNTNIELVMFEHKHLKYADYKAAIELLNRHGYVTKAKNHSDSIAIKPELMSKLGI